MVLARVAGPGARNGAPSGFNCKVSIIHDSTRPMCHPTRHIACIQRGPVAADRPVDSTCSELPTLIALESCSPVSPICPVHVPTCVIHRRQNLLCTVVPWVVRCRGESMSSSASLLSSARPLRLLQSYLNHVIVSVVTLRPSKYPVGRWLGTLDLLRHASCPHVARIGHHFKQGTPLRPKC